MRFRNRFLSFLLILALCTGFAVSACAEVTRVSSLGDGTVEVRWDSDDDYDLVFVYKTGDDFNADLSKYGYFTLPAEEGKTRKTVYYLAPGQSYWVLTLGPRDKMTTPYAYDVPRATNFNEWNTVPKVATFELKKRDSVGKVSKMDYFLAADLEDLNSYDSYGFKGKITWPQLKAERTFFWQFVITLPDGYKHVLDQAVLKLPKGGYYWHDDYIALEDFFHEIMKMRGGEVPVGEYTFSLYWSGQHVSSVNFWVR